MRYKIHKYFKHYVKCFKHRGYDSRHKKLFFTLVLYSCYYFEEKNKKGLLLCNTSDSSTQNIGIGKTYGMEIIHDIFKIKKYTASYFVDLAKFNNNSWTEKLKGLYTQDRKDLDLIIDDLGAEGTFYHFGNQREILREAIDFRYEEYKCNKAITFFTSNLTENQIYNRYGLRIFSRLKEMCTFIEIDGADSRLMKNRKTISIMQSS